MKLFEWLVRLIFWLQAFIAPLLLFGVIAIIIYVKTERGLIPILTIGVGILAGIFFAEYVRRKYGLENFFGRIYRSNDLGNKTNEPK